MSDDKIRALIERGRLNLVTQVEEVSRLLPDELRGDAKISAVSAAQAITHQMKGTSGTIGFMDFAKAAAALDDELKTLMKQENNMDTAGSSYQALLLRLRSIAKDTRSELSTLYDVEISALVKS